MSYPHLPHLYNFHRFDLPDGVIELLDLLEFYTLWDNRNHMWRVFEKEPHSRMKWTVQEFGGGTTEDWQKFLSSITSNEHLR